MSTEEKILSKALEMFNQRGVEYVGLRELAATLNMRVGNITYYFPTKDDLVDRLSLELKKLNSEIVISQDEMTLLSFMEMIRSVFHNHVKYRCLLLSFVHLMEQNKAISARYKTTETERNQAMRSSMTTLVSRGYLDLKNEVDSEYLVSMLSLIIRFWISEAAVSHGRLSVEEQISHYLSLIVKLLMPFATDKAKKELDEFLIVR